jgi:hypothetical protein
MGRDVRTWACRRSTSCFNADERVVCERVFLPPKQEIADCSPAANRS